MTGGLGFTKLMQSTYKNNRDLLKGRSDRNYMPSGSGKKATYKEATPEQLQELREKMKKENAKSLKRRLIILTIAVTVTGLIIYSMLS